MTIKEARQQAGLTQKALSERLEIPKRTLEDWELGARTCPAWCEKIACRKNFDLQKRLKEQKACCTVFSLCNRLYLLRLNQFTFFE